MKNKIIILFLILFGTSNLAVAQIDDTIKIKPFFHEVNYFVEDNEGCLKCHGEQKFSIVDSIYDRTITKKMYSELHVDRDEYYSSVHKSFSCTDCHSYDFYTFPHNIEARTEEQLTCMDCHGYDETYAHYHFEDIEIEVAESIHNIKGFSCWKCHNPHSYKSFMRNAEDIEDAILYDNNMCLQCHADFEQFMVLTDRSEINILEQHDWLPNQAAHFVHIRCIVCHTEINDTILIAHKILSKENAVRVCAECHSKNSRLLHSLYKFESTEMRRGGGVNGVILNNAFVIGANHNVFLNWLSFIIFGCTLLGIFIHTMLRIIKK